jgi:N-acetylglucosamine-6-sulfatase
LARRDFLSRVVGASLVAPAAQSQSMRGGAARRRPNLIFIYTDDQRWDAIAALGRQPWLHTPNMDRLVKEGANFRNSFVTISLCSPSRSCTMTGLYPHKTGVIDNQVGFPDRTPVFVPTLKEAGYTTAYVGKIHVRNFWEKDRGFDYYASFPGQGSYFNNTFTVNGARTPTQGYITDHINHFALEFLKNRDTGKPFAIFVGHKAVHSGFEPDLKYKDVFKDVWCELPKTWDDTYEGRPPYLKTRRKSWHGLDGMLARFNYSDLQRRIAACLISVDDGIGRLMSYLQQTGELDDTVIVYTSDNGFFRGEHGLNDKRAMYEDSIRVPCLVRYPRLIKPGTVFDQMVLNLDLAPTFLDFAGVEKPKYMQGMSWKPILEGKDPRGRESWLYQYYWEKPYPFDPTQYGVRTGRYKYIRYPQMDNKDPEYPMPGELPYDELYDLAQDPLEMHNLAGDPSASSLLVRMQDLLKKTLDQTEYPGGFK